MAQRRMISLKVIDTDQFLDMPLSTQALYFHLITRADDDGFFANPKKILRMTGNSEDDLKILFAKQFIIPFEDGVCVIKHWKIHNLIRSDRYTETIYKYEKAMLEEDCNKAYITSDNNVIPTGNQLEPQVSIGKDSIVKVSKEIDKDILFEFEEWYKTYPRHEARKKAETAYINLYKKKLLPDLNTHVTILKAWKESGRWNDKKYIPLPASWLNAERWNDDLPEREKTALDYLEEVRGK